jgi:hypothetical protein
MDLCWAGKLSDRLLPHLTARHCNARVMGRRLALSRAVQLVMPVPCLSGGGGGRSDSDSDSNKVSWIIMNGRLQQLETIRTSRDKGGAAAEAQAR